MDISLDMSIAAGYTSNTQIARRITEDWATRNMYCLSCVCNRLTAARNNSPVMDYTCPDCGASYQLKSKKSSFGKRVANSAFSKKMAAIEEGRAPHYAFLRYSRDTAQVSDFFMVPGHLFNTGMIARRNPLPSTAQRAYWVGSTILLGQLPPGVQVGVISKGVVRDPQEVRDDWSRYNFLQADSRARGGWAADVLLCARRLTAETGSAEFTLKQFYERFMEELQVRYPDNHHVGDKIRQQLQILRDGKAVVFLKPGVYRLTV